jgi:hypothetical protein
VCWVLDGVLRCACMCGCLRVCSCVCLCSFVCVHAAFPCARVRACMRACVRAFPSDCVFARVCVASVCVCSEHVCAPRRCMRPHIAQRRRAVSKSRPTRVGGRARVIAFGATGRARARRPQVSHGRAVPSRRNGLRETRTRPWSTPPAPSTSSAASATTALTPTSRMCGRAPTAVRGRTGSGGWSAWYSRGALGVLRGAKGGN